MTDLEAIKARHSVRRYIDKKIEQEKIDILNSEIAKINSESGLNIILFTDEPNAFKNAVVHYGKFCGVKNYFAMVGKNNDMLQEKVGYYGEKLVLLAQKLNLNTCWVAMKLYFSKKEIKQFVKENEKCVCVIALGYGETQGTKHKSKDFSAVANANENPVPDWFKSAVNMALLAPTAMNQQKFNFSLINSKLFTKTDTPNYFKSADKINKTTKLDIPIVKATTKLGFYTKIDLGIAKLHFEIGAGIEKFEWSN